MSDFSTLISKKPENKKREQNNCWLDTVVRTLQECDVWQKNPWTQEFVEEFFVYYTTCFYTQFESNPSGDDQTAAPYLVYAEPKIAMI